MRKNNLKKRMLIIAATLMIGAAGVGSTMAYFTETSETTNVFTVGDLDIGLHETEWDEPDDPDHPTDDEDGGNMYPGYTVYKNPTVKNLSTDKNGTEPCYARINIEIVDNDKSLAAGKDVLVEDQAALDLIRETIYFDRSHTANFDKKGSAIGLVQGKIPGYSLTELAAFPTVNPVWVQDATRSTKNKWVFKYMGTTADGKLKIGEESTLFTNVVIPTDWNQTEMQTIGDYRLKITAEAIQCKGFATQEDAYKALDSEITAGTIQSVNRGKE